MSTRTKILVAVAGLAILVIVLSRGGPSGPELQQLQDDPMAAYVPPGGTLIDSASRNAGMSLGRPVEAQVTRLFQLRAGAGRRALDDARVEAEASGWTLAGAATARGFVARKESDGVEAELAVALVEDARLLPKGAKPPSLSVNLRRLAS